MTERMNRRLFFRLAGISSMTAISGVLMPQAQAGVGGGFATEWTQILNNVQLVASYVKHAEQLVQQIKMVEDMALNTAALPEQVFAPIAADLAGLHRVVQGGRSLAYSMGNLDTEFRRRFQGWGYSGNWYTDYRDWSQTSLDTTLGTLRAANLQMMNMESEEGVLNQLRSYSTSADGRLKILQTGTQIAEQQVQQLQKLRQIMLADIQSKQAFQAAQIQKETTAELVKSNLLKQTQGGGDRRSFIPGW